MKFRFAAMLVLLALNAGTCGAALEFAGYLQTEKQPTFMLTDTAEARSSGWLALGQSFNGYTLVDFDLKAEVLSLRNGDRTLKLPLKQSQVRHVNPNAPEITRQLVLAKEELAEMRKRYLEAHPRVKDQLARIADLEKQLMQEK